MKLIKPYFEIIEQQPGEVGMLKHIETCGRVAWKSEERITDDSYVKFIEMLKGVNHGSVLEHGTVYLKMYDEGTFLNEKYTTNEYSSYDFHHGIMYVTTNYRVLVENNWLDDLKYQCEPTEFHEKRITVRVVADRGVSHEYVRHRSMTFTQESTRYCNYSKDKFGNELTFIIPCWSNLKEGSFNDNLGYDYIWQSNIENEDSLVCSNTDGLFMGVLNKSEQNYIELLENGWKPQQARAVLPNSLKTELIMTGFISDWKHFFELRTAKGAHPQASEIAIPLQEEFIKRNLI